MCTANRNAHANTNKSPWFSSPIPVAGIVNRYKPAMAETVPAQIHTPMRRLPTAARNSGTRAMENVVMNAALEGVVVRRPTVWKAKPLNSRHPVRTPPRIPSRLIPRNCRP